MTKRWKKRISFFLCVMMVTALVPFSASAENSGETPQEIQYLSYEEAVEYFDFDTPATNWCINFGMDPETRLNEAKEAILAGTNRQFIIALATYARDTGHAGEKLIVSNAFRPACYQEVIGLHDSNSNTGPYRKAMTFNDRSVTDFWWSCEEAEGWPQICTLDLSNYDIDTLDLRYFYRAALRLWDNGWVSNYYAKPGCSTHNSGCAMDLQNYWIAMDFSTSHTYQGKTYHMADYGLYKPLQPSATSSGESWHITCTPAVLALGNYDSALQAGFEVVYCLYYNPVSRGWTMDQGRGVYLGAGVVILQIALYRLGLLDSDYITGYYCSETEKAVIAFQQKNGLDADGVCGSGTMTEILKQASPVAEKDSMPPKIIFAETESYKNKGFSLNVRGYDETALNAFRVDTRKEGEDVWVSRYYNVQKSEFNSLNVDIWEEGRYETRISACDAYGNESEPVLLGEAFVDTTEPTIQSIVISDIKESALTAKVQAADNGKLALLTFVLTDVNGSTVRQSSATDADGSAEFRFENVEPAEWNISVIAEDEQGNSSAQALEWTFLAGTPQYLSTVRWFAPLSTEIH